MFFLYFRSFADGREPHVRDTRGYQSVIGWVRRAVSDDAVRFVNFCEVQAFE